MQLTFPPVRAYGPRWSPDNSQIAFMDVQFGVPRKIRLISPTGGNSEVLVQSNMNAGDPTWMPDGKSIVFSQIDGLGGGGIYLMDLKSRKATFGVASDRLDSPASLA